MPARCQRHRQFRDGPGRSAGGGRGRCLFELAVCALAIRGNSRTPPATPSASPGCRAATPAARPTGTSSRRAARGPSSPTSSCTTRPSRPSPRPTRSGLIELAEGVRVISNVVGRAVRQGAGRHAGGLEFRTYDDESTALPVFRARPSRRGGRMKAGDELPPLEIPITRTLIVAGAIASRDYQDVHHDAELARGRRAPRTSS